MWEDTIQRTENAGFVGGPWQLWQFRRKANVFFRNAGWVRRSRLPGFVRSVGRKKRCSL